VTSFIRWPMAELEEELADWLSSLQSLLECSIDWNVVSRGVASIVVVVVVVVVVVPVIELALLCSPPSSSLAAEVVLTAPAAVASTAPDD